MNTPIDAETADYSIGRVPSEPITSHGDHLGEGDGSCISPVDLRKAVVAGEPIETRPVPRTLMSTALATLVGCAIVTVW